ncbi:unnamed protein product [Alternaria alternata]
MGSIQQHEIATLNSLAAQISELAAKMTKQLEAENVTPVTLEADSPIKYEKLPEIQGPSESVFNYVHMAIPDTACLNVLNQFDFWGAVPVDGEATFEDIARHTKLPLEVVSRVIDHAVTMRFFHKPSPTSASVKHSSRSAALAKDSGLSALVQMVLDETGPPMFLLPEALRRFSQGKPEISKDIKETAFRLCHSGGEAWGDYETSWEFIENDGEGEKKGWRQRNFVKFMAYIKDLFHTENMLGGSAGHDDAVLATKFPNLKIVVQDLPEPVQADIYMLKWILHDWPDVESVKILQALRPALRPGARVLFIDYVGKQEPSNEELPRSIQGFGTATDLRMMALFNAKERPVEAWKDIFKQADERYDVVRVEADPLSFMCVLEAVWRG